MTSEYAGTELELFAGASNWKRYWASEIAPWIGQDVLEVGAGIGSNTELLIKPAVRTWVCLEPDEGLAARIRLKIAGGQLDSRVTVRCATTASLAGHDQFDQVLYVDVLEHIEDDSGELRRAARALRPGGCVVVVAPAHGWLYSAFDKAIGHYRRYTRDSLARLTPPSLRIERAFYLDSAGMFASLANRAFLRQAIPSQAQILFWDRVLVPISRVLDRLAGRRVGKSIVTVWRREVGG